MNRIIFTLSIFISFIFSCGKEAMDIALTNIQEFIEENIDNPDSYKSVSTQWIDTIYNFEPRYISDSLEASRLEFGEEIVNQAVDSVRLVSLSSGIRYYKVRHKYRSKTNGEMKLHSLEILLDTTYKIIEVEMLDNILEQ